MVLFVVVFFFHFTQLVILENLSILDLALSGVKGLISVTTEPPLLQEGKDRNDESKEENQNSLKYC